jgi:hypothetical protein
MGKVHPAISEELAAFCEAAPVFFVATAPSISDGHINLSPKGYDTFRVLGPHEVAYLDVTGSGVETIAHLGDDGRITFLFCAFAGAPQLVRLHGRGEAVLPDDPRFADLAARFPARPGVRSVIRVDVERVSDSCGWSVPVMDLVGERDTLDRWAVAKGPDGVEEYQRTRNATSIDGLPGLRSASGASAGSQAEDAGLRSASGASAGS